MAKKTVGNAEIVAALREMALRLEMEGVPYKPRAYERAARSLAQLGRPIAEIHAEGGLAALIAIPGIGRGIARRIVKMLDTGHIRDLDRLHDKQPADVLELDAIEGLGPKRIQILTQELGVRNLDDLRRAAEEGKIRGLPRFGAKLERKILAAVNFRAANRGRRPLSVGLAEARALERALADLPGVARVAIAGSIRRRRETIGDIDLVVASREPERISAALASLSMVEALPTQGPTKSRLRLTSGLEADLRVVPPESFGAALLYFTGSKAHNVALRKFARERGLKLNEYGLFRGEERVAGREEDEVYEALGLDWVPPEIREDEGEIELAARGQLPDLVEPGAIRGDLQVHTTWSDGKASIESMARAAAELGREYLVISDHGHEHSAGTGLDPERLRAQIEEIHRIDAELPEIRVLTGVEVDILEDGRLDLPDDLLDDLDVVGAAIHSDFDQPSEAMTERILRAIANPRVDMLCHPTCRMPGKRPPIEFDFDAVARACVERGTILEIDARPSRLDLPDELIHRAIDAGARIAIDSDAHDTAELGYIEDYGIGLARRGWAGPDQVVNTLPVDELLETIGARRSGSRELQED